MKIYSIDYKPLTKPVMNHDCDDETLFQFSNQFFGKERESYSSLWKPPSRYHLNDNPVNQTFFNAFAFASFAFYDVLLEDKDLVTLLESFGELLSIPCSDSDKTIIQFHCMRCIGNNNEMILDREAAMYPTSTRNKIVFRKDQMPDRGLFWLSPSKKFLYTVENEELGLEHNFKMLYEARGYTGLDFVEAKLI
jgi:hypothetical protein